MPAPRILIVSGDIVEQQVDAIINAANTDLVLGAGVAGAIRTRGGATIQQECDAHGLIRAGEAAITGGGELPARYVIHAASMDLGGITTSHSLRSSMDHVFRLAREHDVRTIAIPAVGTGIGRIPMDECAMIMGASLRHALISGWAPKEVRFVLFGEVSKKAFEGPFAAFFQAPFYAGS
ncbi:MAG: macro domain-containing protein [Candidatus Dormibacteraceae bacterium]